MLDSDESARLLADIQNALSERQTRAGPNAGTWEPTDPWSSAGGRIYTTAMATLSLQACQRTARFVKWREGVL
ncbi:MAG: hypothetical protein JXR37_28390 [Kiritimatiellae bacterium]|nr:hypothetical protein [Kiritimatiellia bacterium]